MLPSFLDSVVSLITRTSTDLPPDVRQAMGVALATEERSTRAGQALTIIAQNIDQAASCEGPICQDTGMWYGWFASGSVLPAGPGSK